MINKYSLIDWLRVFHFLQMWWKMHSLNWNCYFSSNTISGHQKLSIVLSLKCKRNFIKPPKQGLNQTLPMYWHTVGSPFYRIMAKLLESQQSDQSMYPLTGPHTCLPVCPQTITTLSCLSPQVKSSVLVLRSLLLVQL